jgi:hypothetical protein
MHEMHSTSIKFIIKAHESHQSPGEALEIWKILLSISHEETFVFGDMTVGADSKKGLFHLEASDRLKELLGFSPAPHLELPFSYNLHHYMSTSILVEPLFSLFCLVPAQR